MVSIEIKEYTKDLIPDVIDFEKRLRQEENFWGWKIDDKYVSDVYQSFDSIDFQNSLSLLAYVNDKVVGRIDSSIIFSHFDGRLLMTKDESGFHHISMSIKDLAIINCSNLNEVGLD